MMAAIQLIYEIVTGIKGILAFIEQNKNEAWFQDSAKAFNDFKQKSPEERAKLAADISSLLKRM